MSSLMKIENRKFLISRYNCEDNGPRPESYIEDYSLAMKHAGTEQEKNDMYWELKTGAETGWDYSSRLVYRFEGQI